MKKCVTYLRLSKEDEMIRDESNSIRNQRELIRDHIRKIPELRQMEQVEFSDDGYSGKNMNRPAMQELLAMVRQSRVACIVVKDISRFSRDHLETGRYLEQIFPFMGVRFIAINDNYDSKDYAGGIGEIDVAFKGILYDFYSEDLSEKVTTAIRARNEQGKYMGALAPYGYRKDPKDKNRLLVDDEAAEVVRRIFREYLGGSAIYRIVQELNQEGVETPSAYNKRHVGYNCVKEKDSTTIWTTTTVSRILRNEFYIGTFIYHKYAQPEVAAKTKKVLDPSEWKRIENNHEAVIRKEDFRAAQTRLAANCRSGSVRITHCLSGKVFCGLCGHAMRHEWNGRPKYTCAHTYMDRGNTHERNSITDEQLESAVLAALQKEFDVQAEAGRLNEEKAEQARKRIRDAEGRLQEMRNSLEKLYADQMDAFEAYKSGMTDRDTFLDQRSAYEQMEGRLQENIQRQMEAIRQMEQDADAVQKAGIHVDAEQVSATQLTKELAETFVDRITIWPGQRLEIRWKFR